MKSSGPQKHIEKRGKIKTFSSREYQTAADLCSIGIDRDLLQVLYEFEENMFSGFKPKRVFLRTKPNPMCHYYAVFARVPPTAIYKSETFILQNNHYNNIARCFAIYYLFGNFKIEIRDRMVMRPRYVFVLGFSQNCCLLVIYIARCLPRYLSIREYMESK